ncbi:MAG: RNA polymerase sporulation sigma factor SigF [Eubacterium sp.]
MDTIALIKLAHAGDKEARDTLVMENLGLIWSIVRRFANRGYEQEDLFQIGTIGLIKAIDKFDTGFDVKFSTYAVPMIAGEIKRFLRDDGMIKVSRSLKETAGKARLATENLEAKLGREPTTNEVATEIGATTEELVMAMESVYDVESLHKTIYRNDGNEIYLVDKVLDDRDEHEELLNNILLKQMLESINSEEREIIMMRYFAEKTQMEIAAQLGISQVQVSRLEKKILRRMRENIE